MKGLTKKDKRVINTIANPLKNYDWVNKVPIKRSESSDVAVTESESESTKEFLSTEHQG